VSVNGHGLGPTSSVPVPQSLAQESGLLGGDASPKYELSWRYVKAGYFVALAGSSTSYSPSGVTMPARAIIRLESGMNHASQKTRPGTWLVRILSDRRTAGQLERCKTPEATALFSQHG
jgi:hypothetical protein